MDKHLHWHLKNFFWLRYVSISKINLLLSDISYFILGGMEGKINSRHNKFIKDFGVTSYVGRKKTALTPRKCKCYQTVMIIYNSKMSI